MYSRWPIFTYCNLRSSCIWLSFEVSYESDVSVAPLFSFTYIHPLLPTQYLNFHLLTDIIFNRYQVGVARAQPATYRNLLTKLPGGSSPLENVYDAIEQKISQVREYVDEWLRYVFISYYEIKMK